MEKVCNGQELDIPAVYEVIGEPAIVINGVPDVTPGSTACIMDTTTALESDDDPCFGDWLEGRKVQKVFGDKYYFGKVEKYDSDTKWYRVVYEDGDFEDLEWHELEELLLPLDLSVPITILASEKVFPNSQIKMGRKRKNYLNSSGREGKTSELLQIIHVGEARDETLMGADFSGRTLQGSLGMQNGLKMENRETYVLTHEYTTTSATCNGQKLYSVPIFEGEPSVLINHAPAATPGYSTTIHDAGENTRAVDSPYFGKCLEGRKVQKFFGDRYYSGNVEKYDEETKWYRVVYEDGDFEDLEWHELEEVLLPLDVSTPLTSTASHRYKSKKSAPKSQVKKARGRKNHANSLTRKGKTSQLLQITKVGKLRDEKLMEENFSGMTSHGTLQMQNGLQTENQGICDGQASTSAPVFDVVGEPAVVINGVPVATPGNTTIQDNVDNPELADGPSFGEWLEGRQVQKLLGDQHYSGKVERYNKGTKRYRVVYEDGGFEDLQWHELEGMLVPFDISVPITTLASNLCKSGNFFFEQRIKLAEPRKDNMYSFQNMEKAVKPVEANSRDWAHQGNAQLQKGSTIEGIEADSQMRKNVVSVLKPEEGSITSKDNQNQESMDKTMNMFQAPEKAIMNGDGLILADAHIEEQLAKKAQGG